MEKAAEDALLETEAAEDALLETEAAQDEIRKAKKVFKIYKTDFVF